MSVMYNYVRKQIAAIKFLVDNYNRKARLARLVKLRYQNNHHHQNQSNFKPEQYTDKNILAPMILVGRLEMRLMSLRFGADLVYTEELIDRALLKTKRIVNDELKTIDFIDETDGTLVLRTCDEERKHVIVQIGTADPEKAVKVAELVQNDVAGIDVNMGCPKDYAIRDGTGSALLQHPQKIQAILTSLVQYSKVPITCKVRVFPSLEETIKLCEMIQNTGVSALAVHGRLKEEDKHGNNRNHFIKAISNRLAIPVIANGDSDNISSYPDILRFKESTSCSSAMMARAVCINSSIFRKEGLLDRHEIIRMYLKLAIDYQEAPNIVKYNLLQGLTRRFKYGCDERRAKHLAAKTVADFCDAWGLRDYYDQKVNQRKKSRLLLSDLMNQEKPAFPLVSYDTITIVDRQYIRPKFPETYPKHDLQTWLKHQETKMDLVVKRTCRGPRHHRALASIDNGATWYGSSVWEKSSKRAEQLACQVLIDSMQLKIPLPRSKRDKAKLKQECAN